jgi:uncharacterized protein YyaL (SSP411 family)
MARYFDGAPHLSGLLSDQVFTALALLDAYQTTGDPAHLECALELASLLEARFFDGDRGGFFDVWEGHDSLGRLDMRQKPLTENAFCAELFLKLEHFTREPRYLDIAPRTLEHFVGQQHGVGHFASAYARAVDLYLHPQADVKLVGARDQVADLHAAALRLRVSDRTVQLLEPARDGDRLAALALPAQPAPAAYVCFGTVCSAPVRTPDELQATVAQMQEQALELRAQS